MPALEEKFEKTASRDLGSLRKKLSDDNGDLALLVVLDQLAERDRPPQAPDHHKPLKDDLNRSQMSLVQIQNLSHRSSLKEKDD